MPDKQTLERVKEDQREGKSPSTQAGEFVRQEIDHIREGKHGARNTKQAIAIGLSEARRAGIALPPPPGKKGKAASKAKKASAGARSKQARSVARKRTPAQRSASAKKAARTRARERH